jgi:hypothetical protein
MKSVRILYMANMSCASQIASNGGVRIKINPGLGVGAFANWPHRRGVNWPNLHGPRREKAKWWGMLRASTRHVNWHLRIIEADEVLVATDKALSTPASYYVSNWYSCCRTICSTRILSSESGCDTNDA